MQAPAEREAEGKLPGLADVQLAQERDVAVLRDVEIPVHPEVLREVGPAVAGPDVAARSAEPGNRRGHREPDAVLVGREQRAPRRFRDAPGVVPAADVEVWREQRVELQPRQQILLALESGADQDARLVRIGDDLLDDAIAAVAGGAGDANAERVVAERLQPGL